MAATAPYLHAPGMGLVLQVPGPRDRAHKIWGPVLKNV